MTLRPELVFQDQLYVVSKTASSSKQINRFEVFRSSDGHTWEKVVDGGFGAGGEQNVYGWLTEFKGELFLTGETLDPPVVTPTNAIERTTPQGFRLYRSSDGTNWRQDGKDGFGADSSFWAEMSVIDGSAYLAVQDYRQGNQLWRSEDGQSWKLIFREPDPSLLSQGGRLLAFQGHLLWVTEDLKRGVEIWRTNDPVVGGATTSTAGEATTSTAGQATTTTTGGNPPAPMAKGQVEQPRVRPRGCRAAY